MTWPARVCNEEWMMKNWLRNGRAAAALGMALVMLSSTCYAEDIDLFSRPTSVSSGVRPNILIMLDNSANWSAANQKWPGGIKQGEAELRALRNLVGELKDNVNVGLMMYTAGSG